MNSESRMIDPAKVKMTYVEFEAWPATGLIPSRFCFLHAYFTQSRKDAKKTSANPLETLVKETTRAH